MKNVNVENVENVKRHKRGRPRKETRQNKPVNVEPEPEPTPEQIQTVQATPVNLDDDEIEQDEIMYCVLLTKEEYKLLKLFKHFFTKLDKI